MENKDRTLGSLETATTIIVNIGTIASWIFTFATALVLVVQPEPIFIPKFFEIGKAYILLFLISVLLGYIHLLQYFWKRKYSYMTFGSYLYDSIIKFKRPISLVGFATIFLTIYQIEPVGLSVLIFLAALIGISLVFTLLLQYESLGFMRRFFLKFDYELRMRWLKRIKRQLHTDGYASTSDFKSLDIEEYEINWALKTYFDQYEFEQDLALTIKPRFMSLPAQIELRFNHLPSRIKT